MKNYKDLIVWQKAHALVLYIYKQTVDFPKAEQFNLTSQVRRAATSIPTNLAEGCGKYSQADFAKYLQIAWGSANEVEYLSLLAHEIGYLKSDPYKEVTSQVNEVRAMLISLVTKVRRDARPNLKH